ncbi:hypothetical protein HPB49_015539 [Dermacentor silvarum]|uniref:Uncharacterized protein n=1 Tax=Dermacentor silvarum TaxID=543639 RepID=A0ACB8DPY3_DERSI|nr:uncharacterized protein LOC119431111 isoform X2 [Dermacentor silvarum]XP_049513703.1 uncharacterized protein LOC119431111 isoform X3 [Dermacentor silvarum]KAH7974441.1 hypothetical protein HPB49_015539 [Dermacentor silvarum]
MPDHGRRALHRVCDSVSGVNWRPTRFVDELVLARYACCVCHVIPTTTVVLPCCHALCEECQAGCVVEGGGSVCPLDGEPFSEDECETCHLPAKKKRDLKAHCWNEAHGCDFVGPLEALLRHFEAECTFHSFPCQRCGEDVPNTKLAAHYISGCRRASSSAAEAKSSGQGGVLVTAGNVTAAGRVIGKPVRYTCEDEVTVLQSQVNELAEAARMQNATLASSPRGTERQRGVRRREILGGDRRALADATERARLESRGKSSGTRKWGD